MEPTLFEDSMEVGSDAGHPHPDNVDIEIDLDFAHDQNAGRDDDVLVEDASVTASDHGGEYRETVDDADMLDEEYMDAQGGYELGHEAPYQQDNGAVQPGYNEYEAEMEDEYEEDIDAPIPDSATEERNLSNFPTPGQSEGPRPAPDTEHVGLPVSGASSTTVQELPENVPTEEESTKHLGGNEEEAHHVDETTSQPAEGKAVGDQVERPSEEGKNQKSGEQPAEAEPQETVPEGKDEAGQHVQEYGHEGSTEEQAGAEDYEYVEHGDAEYYDGDYAEQQREAHVDDALPLHPIKVLYQESEVSLFPPREDDLSETFFIEDEALAHKPLPELLQAFRRVLGRDVTEDEELFIDFESLGLHLSENTSHESPISLFQIVRTYLDLCHNDDTNEPEPLYLTLGSRPTFDSTYASLVTAAKDGKGLLHIQDWENYDAEHGEGEETPEDQSTADHPGAGHADAHHDVELLNEEGEKIAPASLTQAKVPEQEEPKTSAGEETASGAAEGHEKSVDHGEIDVPAQVQAEPEAESYQMEEPVVYEEGEWHEDGEDVIEPSQPEGAAVEAPTADARQADHGTSFGEDQDDTNIHKLENYEEAPEQEPPAHEVQPDEHSDTLNAGEPEYSEAHGETEAQDAISEDQPQPAHDGYELSTGQAGHADDEAAVPPNENDLHFDIDVGVEEAHAPEKAKQPAPEEHPENGDLEEGETYEDFQGEPERPGEPGPEERPIPANGELEGNETYEDFEEGSEQQEEHDTSVEGRGHNEQPTDDAVDATPTADRLQTPEPTSLLDIDEDLFRSPTAETYEAAQPTNGQVTSAPWDQFPEKQTHISQEQGASWDLGVDVPEETYVTVDAVDEAAPTTQDKVELSEGARTTSQPGSPKSTKRSQVEAGINDGEGSLPEIKRQRST